jgi:hypothetical protein
MCAVCNNVLCAQAGGLGGLGILAKKEAKSEWSSGHPIHTILTIYTILTIRVVLRSSNLLPTDQWSGTGEVRRSVYTREECRAP